MDLSDRLRTARMRAGFKSAAAASRRFGWNAVAYRHHENGTSGFKLKSAQQYAEAYGVSVEWLLYGRGQEPEQKPFEDSQGPEQRDINRSIPVVGSVAGGIWREIPADSEPKEFLHLDVDGYERATLFALKVEGPSVNKVYPDGRYVIAAPPAEAGVRDGDFVVVQRNRAGLIETTLKQLEIDGDNAVLWPRSDHPDFQAPIQIAKSNLYDQDGVEIIGVVVADYGRAPRRPLELSKR